MMTLMELEGILGEQIREVKDATGGTEAFRYTMEKSEYMAKLSKQMNNTADNIIRTAKMCGEVEEVKKVIFGE